MATVSSPGASLNTTSGTHTLAATPVVGDLIVCAVWNSGNTSSATVTDDQGGVYVRVVSATAAAGANTLGFHVRTTLITSAVSTVFSHAPGASTGGGIRVFTVTGMTLAGSSAVRQSASQSDQGAGGTPTPTFSVACLTSNLVMATMMNATNPATMTPRASPAYVERGDSGYAAPTTGVESMTINSGETGTAIAWGSTSASAFGDVVIELDTSPPTAAISTKGSVPWAYWKKRLARY